MTIERPLSLYDRETEWADLAGFSGGAVAGPKLGIVYGRRRQGKSFMLEALTDATAGFYHQALEEARAPALASFADGLASFIGRAGIPAAPFADWRAAIEAAADQADGRPIVIDEFPYLLRESPELTSVIQAAFDGARSGRQRPFHLILCGSSLSIMTRLLTGQQALRGRATLDMPVHAFDFRQARRFWQIDDVDVAFLVDAVLGGPPGYRDLLDGAVPHDLGDFDSWLASAVLNPSHALFREAEYLLAEDPTLVDRALYRSIIGAIANGEATRRGVASRLGRPETALDHPLGQLERSQFIVRDADLLRANRPLLRVADPLLRFQFVVIRPELAAFEARRTQDAWRNAQPRFRSQVIGPHFERIARTWAERYASARTIGGRPLRVGFAQVNDAVARQAFELDVIVEGSRAETGDGSVILAIGEAKGSDAPRTAADLARLERLRGLLAPRVDVDRTKLLLFGKSGFDADVVASARMRDDVELIDLARLYEGD